MATNLQQSVMASRQRVVAEDQPNIQDFDLTDSPVAKKKNKPRKTWYLEDN